MVEETKTEETKTEETKTKKKQRPELSLVETFNFLDDHLWLPKYNVITQSLEISPTARADMALYTSPDREVDNFIVYVTDLLKQEYTYVSRDIVTQYVYYIATTDIIKKVYPDRTLTYNPVHTALENHTGKYTAAPAHDYLAELYEIMHISESDTLSRLLIHKWLLQALAILHNGYIYNGKRQTFGAEGVLVLNGSQGIGKSLLAASLVKPFESYTQKGLFGGGSIKLEEKDSIIQATSKWIYEIGEIEYSFKKSDLSNFKDYITKATDLFRAPYARDYAEHPRHTVYIASCNTSDYLTDPTGSRRFWTIPCDEKFDIDRLMNFDFMGLWVQINEELATNDLSCFRLTTEEQEQLAQRNGIYTAKIPAQQEIEDILARISENPDAYEYRWTTATDFMQEYVELQRYNARIVGKAITAAFEAMGIEYKEGTVRTAEKPTPYKAKWLPMHIRRNIQITAQNSSAQPYKVTT